MSGHVFHPGHDELHGVTVVVTGASGRTYVGRWHERDSRGLIMHDVAIHDPATDELPKADWLARQQRFGVAVAAKFMIVPGDEAADVRRLDNAG
ncbi:MAG: hypothetical protein ACREL5_06915 [Gemmatimonadales bacterium]